MGAMNPFNVQNHFRIRSDTNTADGGAPTWQTTEDQANSPTSSLTWATATTFRIRYVVSNTGSAISNADFQLFVSKNGGAYAAVTTTSSNVQAADAGSDADATVLQSANYVLTAGSGTAANGEYSEDGIVSSNITEGTYMEVEFGLTIVDADVSNNDTLDFRVYYNGATMDSYTITPRITVSKSNTLIADAGSYSLSGQTTGLAAARIMGANAGSYTLTGPDATLSFSAAQLTRTNRQNAHSTANSVTTASFTPSANSLLVAVVGGVAEGVDPTSAFTMAGGSLTWTRRIQQVNQDPTFGWYAIVEIYTAPVGASPASMTAQISSSTTMDGIWISTFDYTNYDTSSPFGATASGLRDEASGSFSITLSGAPATTSEVVAGAAIDDSTTTDCTTTGTGWTQIYEFGNLATNETHAHVQVRGNSASTSVTWNTFTVAHAGSAVALEIKEASGGFSLATDTGSYALTGQTVNLQVDWALSVDAGSYSLAGQTVSLLKDFMLAVDAGAYTLTGQSAEMVVAWAAALDAGSYTLTGQDINTALGVPVNLGAYTLTGEAVTFLTGFSMPADAGAYTLTGQAVELPQGFALLPDTGSYAITGQTVELPVDWAVDTDTGAYTLTGQAVTLARGFFVATDTGSYALTGNAAEFIRTLILETTTGSYTITGQEPILPVAWIVPTDTGSYSLTGNTVTTIYSPAGDFPLEVDAGSYGLNGENVTLTGPPGGSGKHRIPTIARRRRRA